MNGPRVYPVEMYAMHLAKMENTVVMAIYGASRESRDREVKGLTYPDYEIEEDEVR